MNKSKYDDVACFQAPVCWLNTVSGHSMNWLSPHMFLHATQLPWLTAPHTLSLQSFSRRWTVLHPLWYNTDFSII